MFKVTKIFSNIHCILHCQALVIKKMSIFFNNVLNKAVKMKNIVKSRILKTRLFKILCQNMGSIHKAILYCTVVRIYKHYYYYFNYAMNYTFSSLITLLIYNTGLLIKLCYFDLVFWLTYLHN